MDLPTISAITPAFCFFSFKSFFKISDFYLVERILADCTLASLSTLIKLSSSKMFFDDVDYSNAFKSDSSTFASALRKLASVSANFFN